MSVSAAYWPEWLKGPSLQLAREPWPTAPQPNPSGREAEGPGGESRDTEHRLSAPHPQPQPLPWIIWLLALLLPFPPSVMSPGSQPPLLSSEEGGNPEDLSPQGCPLIKRQCSYYWEPFRIKCTNVGKLQRL